SAASRPRKVVEVCEAGTSIVAPEEAVTMYFWIGSPFASAVVIAGQETVMPPPLGSSTRFAVGVPAGARGFPAGCSDEDQSEKSEGRSARFSAWTRKR